MKKILLPSANVILFSDIKEDNKHLIGFSIDVKKYALVKNSEIQGTVVLGTKIRVLNLMDDTDLTHAPTNTIKEMITSLSLQYNNIEFFVFDTKKELLKWILE